MKRYDYIQFGALSVLSHIAQGAAFILLFAAFGGTGTTSSFTFATPVGLALGVVYVSALSFLFGGETPEPETVRGASTKIAAGMRRSCSMC